MATWAYATPTAPTAQQVMFYQTPTQGIVFDYADVYMMQDRAYAKQQRTYNSTDWKRTELVMNQLVDSEGRFSVWKFIPSYIKNNHTTPQRLVVEIWFYNEPVSIDSTLQPINEDGDYLIPYRVRYQYKLSQPNGDVLYHKDYGVVYGTFLTQNVNFEDEFPVDDRIGIQAVFTRVRQEVYALYGFSTFQMPFNLYNFDNIKGVDLLQEKVLTTMATKEDYPLNKQQSSVLSAYNDVLSYHVNQLSDSLQPYAQRNLALCKAWLGDTLAVKHLQEYKEHLKTPADSMDYYDIDLFVKYYPQSVQKHRKMLHVMGGDLRWKVDAFTYNDLLCNVYEVEYPIPFLPLSPLNEQVKKIEGQLLQEGKEPLDFTLKYDKKGKLKSLDMNRVEYNDKQKVNVRTNTLHISYKKDEYDRISCSPSEFIRLLMPGIQEMNMPQDKIERAMSCKTDNVLGGFVKLKVETDEHNQFLFDLDGNVYVTGHKSLSRPHGALKKIADENGVKFPTLVSANSSEYQIKLAFDDNDFVTSYQWNGYVLMEKNVGYDNYAYIKADSVVMDMQLVEPYGTDKPGSLQHKVSLLVENKLGDGLSTPANAMQGISYQMENYWPFNVQYDDKGNWVYLQVGPYEIKRTITY